MKRLLLYLPLLMLITAAAPAQPNSIFFDHLGTENGLSSDVVFSVFKDKMGLVWASTADGLNRYDGRTFKKYYSDGDDSNALWNNYLGTITQDEDGDLWIAGSRGMNVMNPLTERIRRIYFHTKAALRGTTGTFECRQNPYDKKCWIGTMEGLFRIDKKSLKTTAVIDRDSLLAKNIITCIWFAHADEIWMGSYSGLIRYQPSKNIATRFKVAGAWSLPDETPTWIVNCIVPAGNNKLWLGTWGHGLQLFDIQTQVFEMYLPKPALGVRGDANIVMNVMPSKNAGEEHLLWIASEDDGFQIFDTRQKKFKWWSTGDKTDRFNVFRRCRALCYATDEGLWIAGYNGLYRYDPHLQTFNIYSIQEHFDRYCLSSILNLYADPADSTGNTFDISTWTCGAFRYNRSDGDLQPFLPWLHPSYPGDHNLRCMFRDSRKRLWVRYNSGHLLLVDEDKRTSSIVRDARQQPLDINVIIEGHDHTLWMAGGKGLYKLSEQNTVPDPVWTPLQPAVGKHSADIQSLAEDKAGNIWFCSSRNKEGHSTIAKIDVQGKIDCFNDAPFVREKIVYTAASGKLWAVSDRGIVWWNAMEAKPVFNRLTRKENLSSDLVYDLAADGFGRVWAATQNGLSCYDEQKKSFSNFFTIHGLEDNEITGVFVNERTHEVIVPYAGKFYVVNTSLLNKVSTPPPVYISAVRVFGEVLQKNGANFFPDKQHVELKANQNNVSIDLMALGFTSPQQNRFAYKMEGIDPDWIYTENNTVNYARLPSGDYTFRVKACNSAGVWNEQGTMLTISVAYPFYKTWWFILLCVLLTAAILYTIYRYRIAQIKQMYRIRTDIARDLHDEIGSTLTSINILSKVSAMQLEEDKDSTRQYLQQINEQSQAMQQNMSDIVWAIKPGEDKAEDLLGRMNDFMLRTLEPQDIMVHFDVAEGVDGLALSMQQRRDIFLIFKEAINNVAKYAAAATVWVTVGYREGALTLSIKDDGKGFDTNVQRKSNGLKNMESRTISLNGNFSLHSEAGKGTGIEILIPL